MDTTLTDMGGSYDNLGKKWLTEETMAARHGFAKKVLGQVCGMLLLVGALCGLGFTSSSATQSYLLGQGQWIMWAGFIVSLFIVLSYYCHPAWYHEYPQKYVTLVMFALSIGTMCMYATMRLQKSTVLLAVGLTASITVFLCAYVHVSKRDFTTMGGALGSFLWLLIMFGFLQIWFHDRILELLVASAGALLFSLYIIYDFSLILGGTHRKHQFSLDDDVLASMCLFLDIINLFLYLLQLLSGGNRDD